MTYIKCDKCGKKEPLAINTMKKVFLVEEESANILACRDFCKDCKKKILDFFTTISQEPAE